MTASPLTDVEFAEALTPLLGETPGPLAVAVSGGRDSMALLHLAARYAGPRGIRLVALTVDHALRPESAAEAAAVAHAARALGLAHRTLLWERPGRPAGNLEAAARAARYRLMAEACAEAGARILLLGHTLDDQAETVLLRLARGSGVDGLAAMAPRSRRLGLTLLRPLLDTPRARLEARLRADGIAWHDDPMNENARFARVQIRRAQEVLARAGLTPARLAKTARHMARARLALDAAAVGLQEKAVVVAPAGYVRLSLAPLAAAPEEIGLRLLSRLLMAVGGLALPPRFEALARLYGLLQGRAVGNGRTLAGCRILSVHTDTVMILREAAALHPPLALAAGRTQLWDGRFQVRGAGGTVRALGADGIRELRRTAPDTPLAGLPAAVRPTLPSLWLEGGLAAIPHLNYAAPAFLREAQRFEARFTGL